MVMYMLFSEFVIDVILFMINHDEHFPQTSSLCHTASNIPSKTAPKSNLNCYVSSLIQGNSSLARNNQAIALPTPPKCLLHRLPRTQ